MDLLGFNFFSCYCTGLSSGHWEFGRGFSRKANMNAVNGTPRRHFLSITLSELNKWKEHPGAVKIMYYKIWVDSGRKVAEKLRTGLRLIFEGGGMKNGTRYGFHYGSIKGVEKTLVKFKEMHFSEKIQNLRTCAALHWILGKIPELCGKSAKLPCGTEVVH